MEQYIAGSKTTLNYGLLDTVNMHSWYVTQQPWQPSLILSMEKQ